MTQYINKAALLAEIDKRQRILDLDSPFGRGAMVELECLKDTINKLEIKEVDIEKESELIANSIMISVQSNKYGTNIYNTERNDFNHSHLQMAARKGIELGLKTAQKGE